MLLLTRPEKKTCQRPCPRWKKDNELKINGAEEGLRGMAAEKRARGLCLVSVPVFEEVVESSSLACAGRGKRGEDT